MRLSAKFKIFSPIQMEESLLSVSWGSMLAVAIMFVVVLITVVLYQSVREPLRRQSRRLRDIGEGVERANAEIDGVNARLDRLINRDSGGPVLQRDVL